MVRLIYLVLLTLLFSCAKEDPAPTNSNDIVGKWLRVEEYVNAGNGGRWVPVTDTPPVTVQFTASGNFSSNHSPYSKYTGYKKSGADSIELTNSVGNSLINKYSIENGKLTILYTCREGCGDRFTRQ
jgi:hypothetical protein